MLVVLSVVCVALLLQPASAAVNYIRWGRTTCSGGATVIYKGYAAGSYWNDVGSGNNYQCLPEAPQWGRTVTGLQATTGALFGTEYQLTTEYSTDGSLFSFANSGKNLQDEDMPCVACYQPDRASVLMIPARVNCSLEGWNTEYSGYLMTQDRNRYRSEYICVDEAPEVIPGGAGDKLSQEAFPVQTKCGSLPCPKYVEGGEVACAVCSI